MASWPGRSIFLETSFYFMNINMYQSQETSSNSTWKYVYFAARKLYETRSTTFWSYYKMPVCILLGHMENITERNLKDGLLQHWIWRQTVWGSERWKEARNFCQNLCVRLEFTFLTQSQIHPDKYNQRELRFKATLGNLVHIGLQKSVTGRVP